MTNPAIQNDFSYYRRQLSRSRMDNYVSSSKIFSILDFQIASDNINYERASVCPTLIKFSHWKRKLFYIIKTNKKGSNFV